MSIDRGRGPSFRGTDLTRYFCVSQHCPGERGIRPQSSSIKNQIGQILAWVPKAIVLSCEASYLVLDMHIG